MNIASAGAGTPILISRDITFSLDTSAYASGDLVADTQELTAVAAAVGGVVELVSITLVDEDDQKATLNFVFLDTNTSMGTENAAPSISDANASGKILGVTGVLAASYLDIGGASVVTAANIGLIMKAAAADTSLYVALVGVTTTPTFTAAGLKAKLCFKRT
jgi:hypothetical protein